MIPPSMYSNTEIYTNLKCISELFKMYTKSLNSFILASRTMESLGCRINAYEILLQNGWLLFFSRHTCNRFAETHSHLLLLYHITDRLLAAGNKPVTCTSPIGPGSGKIDWFLGVYAIFQQCNDTGRVRMGHWYPLLAVLGDEIERSFRKDR